LDALTDREAAVVERARAFAREQVGPRAAEWESTRRPCETTLRQAAREGFAGLLLAERYGGLGVTLETATRVFEEIAAAHLPFAFSLVVHANLVGAIGRLGTPQQIETLLPNLLRGQTIGAFCLTEPGTGSDAAALTTLATRDGAGWRLRGEKAWVTNGAFADLASVYVQTDPARGSRGIAAVLVSTHAPGVERLPAYGMLGGHAMGTGGLRFTDCAVEDGALLAPPGEGFKAAMAGIDLARVLLGGACCGILRESLEHAVAYARDRRAFGRPIADFQGLRWSLADVATELAAARALTYEAARLIDAGGEGSVMAAHAKKFATRAALYGVSACMRAMGAVALRDDYPLGRHLTSAQIAEYLDGTTGIQNVVIARQLFR
jgi:alkylation response protein AidB-like acyl-CoA dehydrogenase